MRRIATPISLAVALRAASVLGGLALAGCDGCGTTTPPGATSEAAGTPETAEPTAEAEAEEEAATTGEFRVTGSHDGVIYVNGRRFADWVPSPWTELEPGRYTVQVLYGDQELGDPRPALVRAGARTSIYLRYGGDLPPDVVMPANSNAESAPPTPPRGRPAVEGSGEPTPSGVAEGSGDGPPPADGDVPVDTTGTALAETADAEEALATIHVRTSAEGAAVFVDGRRTEHRTPAELRVPPGRRTFQVLYEDDTLSRRAELDVETDIVIEYIFEGLENFTMRGGRIAAPRPGAGEGSGEGESP